MARSPLIVQRPQVSLIGGNQLPQASGAGVPVPDIASAFRGLAARLQQKADRNRAIDDQLAGQRDAGAFTGKDADGNYVALDLPDGTPEYRAAWLNTAENNLRATLRSDINARFNEIQLDPELDDEARVARMEGALQGTIDALPPEARAEAFQWGRLEIEQRRNSLASAAFNRQRQAQLDGIRQRIDDATGSAVSAAASGADPSPHRLEVFKAYDELVEQGVMTEATADALKVNAGRFIDATSTQQRIATELFKGAIDPDHLDRFAQTLRAGGDVDLPSVTLRERTPFNVERERDDTVALYSANQLRDAFQDPKTTEAVAVELSRLADFRRQQLKDYEKARGLFDAINGIGENQTLPAPLRDDLNKQFDAWIAADAQESPEGLSMMLDVVRRTKVMPQSLVDVMTNTILSGDYEAGVRMVGAWDAIRKARVGGSDVGSMILRSIPAGDRAMLDAAAAAAQQIASTGPDAKVRLDEWKRFQERSKDPANTVERSISIFNDARARSTDPTFATELRRRFTDEYGLNMPLDFQKEFEQAYHVSMTMSSEPDPAKTFEAAWERVSSRFQASPIYEGGIVRGGPLTNPDGFGPDRGGGLGKVDEHRWINDYVKDQISDMIDAGMLVLDGEDRRIVEEFVLAEQLPLGESIWLEPTGTNTQAPQFNILLSTPGGKVRLRVQKDGVTQPLVIDPGIVRSHFQSKAQAAREIEQLEGAVANTKDDMVRRQKLANTPLWQKKMAVTGMALGLDQTIEEMGPEVFEQWFLEQPEEWQRQFQKTSREAADALEEGIRRINERVIEVPEGVDIGPTTLMQSRAAGPGVTAAAVAQVDRLLPDGTGGQFLLNVASVESDFGRADGTFRASGDRGIMQINTGETGAFREVQRRARIPGNPVQLAAEKLKGIGIDVANLAPSDLDKPLVSVAVARLYMLTDPRPIPADVGGQALIWKDHYNTVLGAGTVEAFVAKAGRAVLPTPAIAGPVTGIPGAVLGMDGKENPSNFLATSGQLQAAALRLSSVFGRELRITPHGGTQADARAPTSQHRHGKAIDVFVEDYDDADKTRLIALAIAQGFRGIGGYAAGDGKGTLHFDIRQGGNGPGGLGVWWRRTPGKDGPWDSGPKWFTDGVRLGLRMRAGDSV